MGALSKSKIHPTANIHHLTEVNDNESTVTDHNSNSVHPVHNHNHHQTINQPVSQSGQHRGDIFFKVNGWTQPFHPLQLLAFFFFFFFTGICFFVMLPMLPTSHLRYTIYSLTGLLFAAHLIFHLINITINPADPAVIDKYLIKTSSSQLIDHSSKNSKGPATFDRSKHNHVIENQFCYICEVTVGPRSKHCSVCNKCVANFDHHCKWLNNCVGGANYRLFIVCVTIAMIGALSIFGLTIVFTVAYFNQSSWFYDASIWEDDFITNGLLRAYIINSSSSSTSSTSSTSSKSSISTIYPSIWITIIILTCILSLITGLLLLHLLCFHIFLNCIGLSTYEFIVSRRQAKDLESETKSSHKVSPSPPSNHRLKLLPSRLNYIARWFCWCCQDQSVEKGEKSNQGNGEATTDEKKVESKSVSINETTPISLKNNHVEHSPLISIHQMNGGSLFGRLTSASAAWNQQQQQHQQLIAKHNGNNFLKGQTAESKTDDNCNSLTTDLYIKSIGHHRSSMLRNSWINNHRSFEESHGQVYLGSPERRFWESIRTNILPPNNGLSYNQITLNNNAKNNIESNSEKSTHSSNVGLIENYPHYQIPSKATYDDQDTINVSRFNETGTNPGDSDYKLSSSLQSTEPLFSPIHFRSNFINGRTSRLAFASKAIDSIPQLSPTTTVTTVTNTNTVTTTTSINSSSTTIPVESNEGEIPNSICDINDKNSSQPSNPKFPSNRAKPFLGNRQLTQPDILMKKIDKQFPSLSIENLRNQMLTQNNVDYKTRSLTIDETLSANSDTHTNENYDGNANLKDQVLSNDNQLTKCD